MSAGHLIIVKSDCNLILQWVEPRKGMTKKPAASADKIAAIENKKTYDFWPLHSRALNEPLTVTLKCNLPSIEDQFCIQTQLVFLNIQGDNFPNFVSVELPENVEKLASKSESFAAFKQAFSTIGNTINLLIDTGKFCVNCYRPVCINWDYKHALFCFKRGPI